jgi:steroid delta-isomerase-like uncharacterized protein
MDNKALYRRYIQTLFNEGKLNQLAELATEDYVLNDAAPGAPKGREAIAHVVNMFRTGFPDLQIDLDELVAERDLVCARSTMRGTHQGTIFGIAPTGKKVAVPGLTMVRFRDGRVAESWVKNDVQVLMNQLGVSK